MRALSAFFADRRGLSAVEFALIAPLLIVFYFATVEIDSALAVNRKVTSATISVADLVAQDDSITNTEMNAIFTAVAAIMAPYDQNDDIEVVISSVRRNAQGEARVVWSDGHNLPARAPNSTVTIPPNILSGTTQTVIMAEVGFPYQTPLAEVIHDSFHMQETFYLRPRRATQVCRVSGGQTVC